MSSRANGKQSETDLTDEVFRNRLTDRIILRFIELYERFMEVHSQLIGEKYQKDFHLKLSYVHVQ